MAWEMTSDHTVIPGRSPAAFPSAGSSLMITYRARETILKGAASFGRDEDNTFVIADPMASRKHAKIDLRTGKFVIVDQSSNGTFVTLGGAEMRLHREETVLHGAGVIAFGHSASQAGEETVEFRCDAAPAADNTTK